MAATSGVGTGAPVEELAGPSVLSSPPGFTMHPGTPPHVRHKPVPLSAGPDNSSFYMSDNIRAEIQHKNALTLVSANPELFPELPLEVINQCIPRSSDIRLGHHNIEDRNS